MMIILKKLRNLIKQDGKDSINYLFAGRVEPNI